MQIPQALTTLSISSWQSFCLAFEVGSAVLSPTVPCWAAAGQNCLLVCLQLWTPLSIQTVPTFSSSPSRLNIFNTNIFRLQRGGHPVTILLFLECFTYFITSASLPVVEVMRLCLPPEFIHCSLLGGKR